VKPARPPQAHRSEIPFDTPGKLANRGHRLFGSYLDCARRYRYELGARNPPSQFDINIDALVANAGVTLEARGRTFSFAHENWRATTRPRSRRSRQRSGPAVL
jgi:hypothetical protein